MGSLPEHFDWNFGEVPGMLKMENFTLFFGFAIHPAGKLMKSLIMFLPIFCLFIVSSAAGEEFPVRTWTDRDGNTIKGQYNGLSSDEQFIRLLVEGNPRRWKMVNFCDDDLLYVANIGIIERETVLRNIPEFEAVLYEAERIIPGNPYRPESLKTWVLNSGTNIRASWDVENDDPTRNTIPLIIDGETVRLLLTELSEDDQEFVKEVRSSAIARLEASRKKKPDQQKLANANFEYMLFLDHVEILRFTDETAAEVVIPAQIDGQPVTKIGTHAFFKCSKLTRVVIPDGVRYIGDWAFAFCTQLETLQIPETVVSIGESAFFYCRVLKNATISPNVKKISARAFAACGMLTLCGSKGSAAARYAAKEKIPFSEQNGVFTAAAQKSGLQFVVHEGTVEITRYTGEAEEVKIPETINGLPVTAIARRAFADCSQLTSVTVPDSVTNVGSGLFDGTQVRLEEVFGRHPNFLVEDGILFDRKKTKLIHYPRESRRTEFAIPDGVTEIAEEAFASCRYLTSVSIPKGIRVIAPNAFDHADYLILRGAPNSYAESYARSWQNKVSGHSIFTFPDGFTFEKVEQIPDPKYPGTGGRNFIFRNTEEEMLLFSSYGKSFLRMYSIWQEMVKDSENLLFKEEFTWRGHTVIAAGRFKNGTCVCVCLLGLTSKDGKHELTGDACALLGMGFDPEFAERFKTLMRTAE